MIFCRGAHLRVRLVETLHYFDLGVFNLLRTQGRSYTTAIAHFWADTQVCPYAAGNPANQKILQILIQTIKKADLQIRS